MDKLLEVIEDPAIRITVKNYFSEEFRKYASNGATREFKAGFVELLEVLNGERNYPDVDREMGVYLERTTPGTSEFKAIKEMRSALRDATAEKQVKNELNRKNSLLLSDLDTPILTYRDALQQNEDI